jgi:hypothetical protein
MYWPRLAWSSAHSPMRFRYMQVCLLLLDDAAARWIEIS